MYWFCELLTKAYTEEKLQEKVNKRGRIIFIYMVRAVKIKMRVSLLPKYPYIVSRMSDERTHKGHVRLHSKVSVT